MLQEMGQRHRKGGSGLQPVSYLARQEPVPVYTLAEALEAYPEVEGVKLDIEGMEMEVLEEVTDWRGVKRLAFEYSHEYDDSGPRFRKIMDHLRSHFTYVRPSTRVGIEGDRITIAPAFGFTVVASTDPLKEYSPNVRKCDADM